MSERETKIIVKKKYGYEVVSYDLTTDYIVDRLIEVFERLTRICVGFDTELIEKILEHLKIKEDDIVIGEPVLVDYKIEEVEIDRLYIIELFFDTNEKYVIEFEVNREESII